MVDLFRGLLGLPDPLCVLIGRARDAMATQPDLLLPDALREALRQDPALAPQIAAYVENSVGVVAKSQGRDAVVAIPELITELGRWSHEELADIITLGKRARRERFMKAAQHSCAAGRPIGRRVLPKIWR